ncbi:GNAT family N-acetyltransferase [bacterium]|nr:GNAT family N-acetyltransferase [bacterium]
MNIQNEKVVIKRIETPGTDIVDSLCTDIETFMGQYRDSKPETHEAVTIALQNGIVLEAVREGQRVGIAVLTRTRFDRFQPHYHLAYIAVDATCRGVGLGKKLLQEVEKVTRGNVALHVGKTNSRAISFYEKLGWRTHYLRMMPPQRVQHVAD